ncbi:16846_t:CDS:2 [Dentiscutata erythropus]|uniref:16846_t:CDS:1 n=1 Tax=Dentiscutata erythropus TaxID=1348616 RepID=A0A9N8VFR4_9GLOM|nr:16846_t:CDS:2 [Dentiscutata erythropus]
MKLKSITTLFLIIFLYILIVHPNIGLSQRSTIKKKLSKRDAYKEKYIRLKGSNCKLSGMIKFSPRHNTDELFGIIMFKEVILDDDLQTQIDGFLTTPIGIDGLKTEEGKYVYTAGIFKENEKIYDITEPLFRGAVELVTKVPKTVNLTICGENSIIGKTLALNREQFRKYIRKRINREIVVA